jgi:hypothetical protein
MLKTTGNKKVDKLDGPFSKPRSKGGLPIVMKDNTLEGRAKPKGGNMNYSGNDAAHNDQEMGY